MAKIRKTEGALMLMTKTPVRTARDNDGEGRRGEGRLGARKVRRDNDGEG